jgi:hypothetical protein
MNDKEKEQRIKRNDGKNARTMNNENNQHKGRKNGKKTRQKLEGINYRKAQTEMSLV